ncbi:MAG: restriction endonuclease subunit S [Salinivirgaceae bacterium]|nr:restriction endonuclease subunit S [Salinivirgaceae bacterium]
MKTMKAKDLKNALLQEAVQGKLVPQIAAEGSAADLLNAIRKEKAELIKAGKIKKEKPLPPITDDEKPFDIPENWVWCYVGDIFMHNTGKAMNSSSKDYNKKGTVRKFITTSNLYWDSFDFTNVKEMFFSDEELERCTATKGDILICEGGAYYGRTAIWKYDYDICIQNHIHRLRPYMVVDLYFFYYIFYLYRNTNRMQSKGTAMPGLSSEVLHSTIIPLPPLSEQKRIVSAIERFMPLIEEYGKKEEVLSELNAAIGEQAKKALLQEAVQGKLVPQIAAEGNAADLLKQIQAEKAQLIKAGKLKKEKPLPPITDDEKPFDIPESWEWCRLGEIVYKLTDGTHRTPKYVDKGVPFLSVKNLSSGKIDFSDIKYITEEEHKELYKRCNPEKGDILLTKVGTTGVPVINDTDIEFSLFVSVALLKFPHNLIDEKYFLYLLLSPLVQDQAKENTRGVGNKNWVMDAIAQSILSLPPLSEQKRIVSALEKMLPLCERLGE